MAIICTKIGLEISKETGGLNVSNGLYQHIYMYYALGILKGTVRLVSVLSRLSRYQVHQWLCQEQ